MNANDKKVHEALELIRAAGLSVKIEAPLGKRMLFIISRGEELVLRTKSFADVWLLSKGLAAAAKSRERQVAIAQAKQIMTDALCCQPAHAPFCVGQNFANQNKHLPPNHPVWAAAPACNCWVGQLGEWLQNN